MRHAPRSPSSGTAVGGGDRLPHPAPAGVTIYYWPCSLILLAPSLVLDRPTGPISATLRIACGAPYTIEVEGVQIQTRASLVAPKAERKRIVALNSDIALLYLPLGHLSAADLEGLFGGRSLVDLDVERFADLLPTIRWAMREILSVREARDLMREAVRHLVGGEAPDDRIQDPRVESASRVLDDMPLNQVSLASVASRVHLSPSRLRDLFKQQTGYTIGDYARWRALWRAVLAWKRGQKLTDVALKAGFHDLAHLDRTFNQVFGMNPSKVIDPKYVTLVNCD